ncbi:Transducin beta-like protein 2 [Acropora cervicornis]|uniref:Transducin beta-like protein 2 n=1 Tax=Acropora cervicornis TaxID=6130 RepID=A0AAD9UTW3_ACRCE|nr:Transducin beta-like protein 2 [Acropora cervicornis]
MPSAAHPLLAASLSGHDSFVEGVEFSSNGKYIMSSSSAGVILAVILYIGLKSKKEENSDSNRSDLDEKPSIIGQKKDTLKQVKGKKKAGTLPAKTHNRQFAVLKGHTGHVCDLEYSLNGKYLASTSQDRTVRLWSVKDFKQKEHQYVRANVEFDHGTKVTFSPDTSEDTKQQQPVRFSKKKEESRSSVTGEFDFPVKHSAEIINIAVASHGKFIMSCSRDTTIILWNLKGEVLSIIDTHQMNNSFASISPCGRFVASAGFTPDVKLWLVEFTKTDEFKQVSRAMELKGHTAVEFTKKQDPHLLITGIYDASFNIYDNMLISMSPDAYVTAITKGRSVVLFNTENGHLEEILQDVHGDAITAISWHPSSRYLATAGGDDRLIRVWHNAAGIKVQIEDLQGRLYRTRNENVKGLSG